MTDFPGWHPPAGAALSRAAAAFVALPHEQLPPSAGVDFLHLVGLRKPAVRVKVSGPGLEEVARWCATYGYAWVADEDGFCCVARKMDLAERVLEVDRRPEPHELELGLLLGYPRCCCDAVTAVGESEIDSRAVAVAAWSYEERFRLIDPSRYRQGGSLICHLPCTPACEPSLVIARRAARFVRQHQGHPAFEPWSAWKGVL